MTNLKRIHKVLMRRLDPPYVPVFIDDGVRIRDGEERLSPLILTDTEHDLALCQCIPVPYLIDFAFDRVYSSVEFGQLKFSIKIFVEPQYWNCGLGEN